MDSTVASPPLTTGPIQYELRIGVTGHRDLADAKAVEHAVRRLLERVITILDEASRNPFGPHGSRQSVLDKFDRTATRALGLWTRWTGPAFDVAARLFTVPDFTRPDDRRLPRVPISPRHPDDAHQTPLKLTVISALAKGADQIVANVVCALIRNPEKRNRYVEAVLPFPQSLYEQDFTEEADLQTFCALMELNRGRTPPFAAPTVSFPNFPHRSDVPNPAAVVTREEAYAAAGRRVIDTSEIIVAVWDPTRQPKPGGTAETVEYALDFGRVVLWIYRRNPTAEPFLLSDDDGSRARADATDEGDPAPRHRVAEGIWATPLPSRAKALSPNFHRMAAYNRDEALDARRLSRDLSELKTKLARNAAALPPSAAHGIVEVLLPYFARADHLGQAYRELRDFAARLWPTTAAIVVSLMAFQVIFAPAYYQLAWIELVLLSLGYASYRVSVFDAWHEKWINDRRLAEGLRAAMFVTLVRSDEDASLGQVRNVLPFYSAASIWFVATLKRVVAKGRRRFAGDLDLRDPGHLRAVSRFLGTAWVQDQANHHRHRAHREERIARRGRRLRLATIGMLGLVASLHALGVGHGTEAPGSRFWWFEPLIAWATVALPAWAAAFHVILSLDDHDRLADRSKRMADLLDGLADQFTRIENVEELRARVNEAERIFDLEATEWAESLGDRKPEFTG